jgi:hypothetical protein
MRHNKVVASRKGMVILGVVVALAVVIGWSDRAYYAQPAPTADGSNHAKAEPADGDVYFGVSTDIGRLGAFEKAAGLDGHPAIYDQYTTPDGAFAPTLNNAATVPGMTPMVSWNLSLADGTVTLGGHDSYLWAQADAVRAFDKPVFVRLDWEMNSTVGVYPQWNLPAVTPAQYIAAWRHVYGVFQQAKATNAVFVWCPNLWSGPNGTPTADWYPGDAYVDWMGVDAYPQSAPVNTIMDLPDGLTDTAKFAAAHHKPLMVGEWAPNLPEPDTAAAMQLIPDYAAQYPKTVKALVYFDFTGGGKDYTLVDHPVGAAALRKIIDGNSHYLSTVVGA